MTDRNIYSCGLIAGLTYREMRHMTPGFILDMYYWRCDYDSRMMFGKGMREMMGKGE
jgi:hypothetical protein